MHGGLGGKTARRIGSVAIHPVLRDVDVKAAQIDGAEMIQDVIDLVELICCIRRAAFRDHILETIQDPAIDESKIGGTCFCTSWTCGSKSLREIVQIPEQNPQRVSDPAI